MMDAEELKWALLELRERFADDHEAYDQAVERLAALAEEGDGEEPDEDAGQ